MNDAVLRYRTAMAVAQGMLRDGVISGEEYDQIDRMIANKYGLDLGAIFCRKPLINTCFRGNIPQTEEKGES